MITYDNNGQNLESIEDTIRSHKKKLKINKNIIESIESRMQYFGNQTGSSVKTPEFIVKIIVKNEDSSKQQNYNIELVDDTENRVKLKENTLEYKNCTIEHGENRFEKDENIFLTCNNLIEPIENGFQFTESKFESSDIQVESSGIRVEHFETQDNHSEIQVNPSEILVVPSEIKVDPSEILVVPSEIKVLPSEIKVEPSEIQVKPNEIQVAPSEIQADPSENSEKINTDKVWTAKNIVKHIDNIERSSSILSDLQITSMSQRFSEKSEDHISEIEENKFSIDENQKITEIEQFNSKNQQEIKKSRKKKNSLNKSIEIRETPDKPCESGINKDINKTTTNFFKLEIYESHPQTICKEKKKSDTRGSYTSRNLDVNENYNSGNSYKDDEKKSFIVTDNMKLPKNPSNFDPTLSPSKKLREIKIKNLSPKYKLKRKCSLQGLNGLLIKGEKPSLKRNIDHNKKEEKKDDMLIQEYKDRISNQVKNQKNFKLS